MQRSKGPAFTPPVIRLERYSTDEEFEAELADMARNQETYWRQKVLLELAAELQQRVPAATPRPELAKAKPRKEPSDTAPAPPRVDVPHIDDVVRAKARRVLHRHGFVRTKP
jgi:hypothetical protein